MNMVEKVARAIGIADLNATAKSLPNVPMETMAKYVKQAEKEGHYDAMARAAIEAMMEPTEFMLSAIYEKGSSTFEYDNVGYGFIEHIWGAGIDAALSEERTS